MMDRIEEQGFQLIEQIADSSRVVTWKAVQTSLNRLVALIVLKTDPAPTQGELDNFLSMAKIYARVKCSAVPSVIDIVDTPELHYIVTDAVDGDDLNTILKKKGPFTQKEALHIALSISEGLSALWDTARVVHRNIKGDNIILSPTNGAKIRQFSHSIQGGEGVDATINDKGMIIGTPAFISPEQAEGSHTLTTQADMYALGCVLYHITTGRKPFSEIDDPVQILTKQVEGKLPSPDTIQPNLSANFSWLLHRMMMKAPEDRYQTWEKFQQDVKLILAGKTPSCVQPEETAPSTIDPSTIGTVQFSSKKVLKKKSANIDPAESPLFKPQASHTLEIFLWVALLIWFSALLWYRIAPEKDSAIITDKLVDPLKEKVSPLKEKILEKVPVAEKTSTQQPSPNSSSAAVSTPQPPAQVENDEATEQDSEQEENSVDSSEPATEFSKKDLRKLAIAFTQKDDPIGAAKKVLSNSPDTITDRNKMLRQLKDVPDINQLILHQIKKDIGKKIQLSRSTKTITVTLRAVTEKTLYVELNGKNFGLPFSKVEYQDLVRYLPEPHYPEEALSISLFLLKNSGERDLLVRNARKCPLFLRALLRANRLLYPSDSK